MGECLACVGLRLSIMYSGTGAHVPGLVSSFETQRYWAQIPVDLIYVIGGCAYKVLQTVQKPGVCSAVFGTVHYKAPLNSFKKSRA